MMTQAEARKSMGILFDFVPPEGIHCSFTVFRMGEDQYKVGLSMSLASAAMAEGSVRTVVVHVVPTEEHMARLTFAMESLKRYG